MTIDSLKIENLIVDEWEENTEYNRVMRFRNDGSSSLKFIYYISGKFFKTPYQGILFLPPGLQKKAVISFNSDCKTDIIEKLVIKTLEGQTKSVDLIALTEKRELEPLQSQLELGKVLCFEKQLITFQIFNKTSKEVNVTLKFKAMEMQVCLKLGMNAISFCYIFNYPGVLNDELYLTSESRSYVMKVLGFAQLPNIKVIPLVLTKSLPNSINYAQIEVVNKSFKSIECLYKVTSIGCKLEDSQVIVMRPNVPIMLTTEYTPSFFSQSFQLDFLFCLNNQEIARSSIKAYSIAPEFTILTPTITLKTADASITDFIVIKNLSDVPIWLNFDCSLEEIDIDNCKLERKETRRIPIVFKPKYYASFSTEITVSCQGTASQKISLILNAMDSNLMMMNDLCFTSMLSHPKIEISSEILNNKAIVLIMNAFDEPVLFNFPSLLNYSSFSIKSNLGPFTIEPASSKLLNFEFAFDKPFLQSVFINYRIKDAIYYKEIMIYPLQHVLSNTIVDKFNWTMSHCSSYAWTLQTSNGIQFTPDTYPRVITQSNSLLFRSLKVFDQPKVTPQPTIQNCSVVYDNSLVVITNNSDAIATIDVSFESKLKQNYSIFPNQHKITCLPSQSYRFPVYFSQKESFKDQVSVYINNILSLQFYYQDHLLYTLYSTDYTNIDPQACILHLRSQKLVLNRESIHKWVEIKTYFYSTCALVSANLQLQIGPQLAPYFNDFPFDSSQQHCLDLIKNENVNLELSNTAHFYCLTFKFNPQDIGHYIFDATVLFKNETSVYTLPFCFDIQVQDDFQNLEALEKLCLPLQYPPQDTQSLMLISYFDQVLDSFQIKDVDPNLECSFKYLHLGKIPCGTSRVPLTMYNKSDAVVHIELNASQVDLSCHVLDLPPHSSQTVVITICPGYVPKLVVYSIDFITALTTKSVYLSALATAWVDCHYESELTHCTTPSTSSHFDVLSSQLASDLLAEIHHCPEISNPSTTLNTVTSQFNDHFNELSLQVVSDLFNIFE